LKEKELTVAILMTCHNRKETTIACLKEVYKNRIPDDIHIDVVLVDDGSTDGTYDAVKSKFPSVRLLPGDGSLFWNRGMHYAFGWAIKKNYDYYMWLNDDTILNDGAILNLLNTEEDVKQRDGKQAIIVGSTADPETGHITYGGRTIKSWLQPLMFELVEPDKEPILCDTMNGNCVLIPHEIAIIVGNLDPIFEHAMGDFDYGLRTRALGYQSWVAPGIIGKCSENSTKDTFLDIDLKRTQRLKKVIHKKNLPFRSWLLFTRRHAGLLWPIYWIWPYIKVYLAIDRLYQYFKR